MEAPSAGAALVASMQTHWEAAESMQSDVSAIEIGLIGLDVDIDSKLGGFHVEAPGRG